MSGNEWQVSTPGGWTGSTTGTDRIGWAERARKGLGADMSLDEAVGWEIEPLVDIGETTHEERVAENEAWKSEANRRAEENGIVFTSEKRGVIPAEEREWIYPPVPETPRTEVMIHRLVIVPHPNADALELAVVGGVEENGEVVGGFRAVVPKDVYKTGDYALYIPEASVLPRELVEELGLVGRLSGAAKNRVKAVKLRGELSQGIVCRPAGVEVLSYAFFPCMMHYELDGCDFCQEALSKNYAETLGIEKWVPKVPSALSGRVMQRGVSRIVPWIEIPNIKKIMRDFVDGEEVIATEKIHGTHCMITYDALGADGAGELLVASKGIGKMGWDLMEEDSNVYWRAVRAHGVEEFMRWVASRIPCERLALYGEVYGPGIQDLTYGVEPGTVAFVAFDLRVDGMWMNTDVFHNILMSSEGNHEVYIVPELYRGPYDYAKLCEVAEGKTLLVNGQGHIREGLVLRPAVERKKGDGSRVIAKFINPAYLLRKGETTEFE